MLYSGGQSSCRFKLLYSLNRVFAYQNQRHTDLTTTVGQPQCVVLLSKNIQQTDFIALWKSHSTITSQRTGTSIEWNVNILLFTMTPTFLETHLSLIKTNQQLAYSVHVVITIAFPNCESRGQNLMEGCISCSKASALLIR